MAETIKGINVVIGAETTGLSKALSDVNKKSRDIQSELKQVDRLLKLDPSNTELLAQKQQLLGEAVTNTREKLNRLRDTQEQVNEQFQRGEISEGQYRAFQREVVKTEQELKKLETQLKDMEPAVKTLGDHMKETGEKMKKAGEQITDVGKRLSTGITAPLAAAGAGLVAVGAQFDDVFDKIRIGTGATGEALEALNEDFRQVARQVPASFDNISTAIADYNTRLGLSGEALQELSTQTLELARITGTDLSKVIEETSQVFQAFNLPAEQYGDALDFVFRVSQSTGISIDRLESNLVKFAPAVKQLGLDFQSAATLMGQLDKAGVDVEQTLAGLQRAVATLAKEGITDANEAIQILFDEIRNAPSDLAGTEKALEVFGTRAGPALASAIREGKLEYQALLAELMGSEETILGVADETKDWAEGFAQLKNNLLLALEPLAGQFFGAINDLVPLVQDLVDWISNLIERFTNLPDGVQKAILIVAALVAAIGPLLVALGMIVSSVGALMPVLAALTSPVGLVVAAVAGLIAGLTILYNKNETVRKALDAAWKAIKKAADTVFGAIKEFWGRWGDEIVGIFKGTFEILRTVFEATLNIIFNLVGTVFNSLKTFWDRWGNTIKTLFQGIWNNIKIVIETAIGVISNLVQFWLNVFRGDWEAAWENVKNIVSSIWDGIKRMFTNAKDVMSQIGKNIIQGLVDGIKNMAGAAVDAAKNIAKNIGDSVKGFFGISSPSRLMMGFGEDIGEGLAIGIRRSVDEVRRQAAMLSEMVIPSFGKPATLGIAAAGSAGNTINMDGLFAGATIVVRNDDDIRQLAREIWSMTAQAQRSLGGARE